MKTIAFLTNNYPPVVDGVGDYSALIKKELEHQSLKVHVFCKTNREITTTSTVHPIVDSWNSFASYQLLVKKLQENKIKKLIVQYVPYAFHKYGIPFNLLLGLTYIRSKGIQLIINFHEIKIFPKTASIRNKLISTIQHTIGLGLHLISFKSIVSIGLNRSYLPFQKKVQCISIPSNIPIKKNISFPKVYDLVCFGIRDLSYLKVLLHLETIKPLRILFLGKIPAGAKSIIEKSSKHQVFITGIISFSAISKYLQHSKLALVLDQGGISTKSGTIAAYFQHQLPIIAMKGHLTDNLFKNQENVDFYKDANSLRKSIQTLLIDDSYYRKRVNYTQETFKEFLDIKIIVQSYIFIL